MAVSIAQFLDRLEASGILADGDLGAIRAEVADADPGGDADVLVKRLHKEGRLTAYQALALWKDKGQNLAFGNYVIEDELGRGGMGVVLKARHKRMQRHVAIKVLPAAFVKDAAAVARFQREVVAAAKLSHTNIVGAHDADEINGQHILVIEFVDGRDLSSIVKKQGPLPVDQAVDCVIQAARGLEYAHQRGVIHRDIKPANLLLDASGTVRILDMGLARFLEGADVGAQAELTGTGTVMGTVDYMSPEQALSTKTADARSDIYSLGITLYYLLTGKPAYEGETLTARLLAHQTAPIPSLASACPAASSNLQTVFEKLVAKQPKDRYQSMTEVITDLETCRSDGSGTAVHARAVTASAADSSDGLSGFLNQLNQLNQAESSGTLPNLPPRVRGRKQAKSSKAQSAWWTDWRVLSGTGGGLVLLLILVFSRGDSEPIPEVGSPPTQAVVTQPRGSNAAESTATGTSLTATAKAPPSAVAPFDAAQAKAHQQAWANYLGLPVEKEIPLSGGEKLTMMLIPPGEFLMGSTDEDRARFLKEGEGLKLVTEGIATEGPQHRVRLSRAFYLSATEITQSQWGAVINTKPWTANPDHRDNANNAASCVNWDEALNWCRLASQGGHRFRLPTEAEWEYACRAGTTSAYNFGHSSRAAPSGIRDHAWFIENTRFQGNSYAQAVGQKRANAWGLFDMHGNVWEWCADWHGSDYYVRSVHVDPMGPATGTLGVLRGGAWGYEQQFARSAFRFRQPRNVQKQAGFGFRVALSIDAANPTTAPAR